MKITLSEPPEGYEAVAEYRHVSTGEVFISESGPRVAVSQYDQEGLWIVLTPKKKKFWRLDPVASFEEASATNNSTYRYCFDGESLTAERHSAPVQWLKLTECSE